MSDMLFYVKEALSIATETSNLMLMLKSYILMAEIEYINDDISLTREFFFAFRDQYARDLSFSYFQVLLGCLWMKNLPFFKMVPQPRSNVSENWPKGQ